METCPHCKQKFTDTRALNIHITIAHVAYKIADIEKQVATLENRCQGLEKSILEVIKAMHKNFLALAGEIQAEAQASYKRDQDLLDRLNVISQDQTKQASDLLEITGGIQSALLGMVDAFQAEVIAGLQSKELKKRDSEQNIKLAARVKK